MNALRSLAAGLFLATTALGGDALVVLPREFTLTGPGAQQRVLVLRMRDGRVIGQLTNQLTWHSTATNVVRLDNSVVQAVANGKATLTAKAANESATADVSVVNLDQPSEVSFRNHVQPVLAKMGCSSGACHGSAAGQNGFKLSLRGYDDEGDYLALTRQALGRRIVPSDPGRSLMLLKPSGAVPHKGGKKFEPDSLEYRVLAEWIAAGAPGPKKADARIERLGILPEHAVLAPGMEQQLVVRALFSDGHTEDVTRWTKYTSANQSVSTVDENGNVQVVGHGEGAITAWYLSRIAIAQITVPYPNQVPAEVFARALRRNFIDDLVLEKLQDLRLPPSPRSSDEEFVRRAYLDTIGVLPSAPEARDFIEKPSAGKRDELIEALLKRPEFVDYWTYKWSDLLLVQSRSLKPPAMWSYYNWIRQRVAMNTPWDVLVRQLITAQGSTLENGAANFYVLHDDPRVMAENTTQAFLGMAVNCAKCHNHPMEKWTNDEYFGFANLFARVRAKTGAVDGDNVIFVSTRGDLVQPLTGKPQAPRPLEGKPLPMDATEDRRNALAEWLVSPENAYFSRAIVNRVWANFMGVGLVESVDDMRATNPASNEKLLAAAAKFLAEEKFDLKALMRAILQSETYQRTSRPLPENAGETRFYSRYYPRRLMAEVLLDALSQVTGAPTQFKGYPEGWRAIQLPDSNVDSYFLKAFGRPERDKTCECERTADPSVSQVLHLANGDTIHKKLVAENNQIKQLLADKASDEKIIGEAYLSALARHPTENERTKILATLAEAKEADRRPLVEDLFWALLSSKEFLFNH